MNFDKKNVFLILKVFKINKSLNSKLSKVKILYVRNLMPSITEDKIFNIVANTLMQEGKDKKDIDEEKLIEKVR